MAARKPEEVRVLISRRSPATLALTFVKPDCPWVAIATKGPPDAVKVVASAYGHTEVEANDLLMAELRQRKAKADKAAARVREKREASAAAAVV